jgi:hypothetical protein
MSPFSFNNLIYSDTWINYYDNGFSACVLQLNENNTYYVYNYQGNTNEAPIWNVMAPGLVSNVSIN